MAYHIARDNQQLGVFEEAELKSKLAAGEVLNTDLAWTEGMAQWKPLGEVLNAAVPSADAANPYAPPVAQTYAAPKTSGGAELASLGQRLGAAVVDGLIFFAAYLPIILAIGIAAAMSAAAGEEAPDPASLQPNFALFGLGGALILALIVVNIVLLAKRGQTIGKRILAIRIVAAENDENPGWVKTIILRSVVNGIISSVPILGGIYALVDICFIFREDRRCIHDLIAGTRVVQGQPPL